MTRRALWMVAVGCLLASAAARADEQHIAPKAADSPELARIKSLAGRWEGTAQDGADAPKPAEGDYKVTSGGSAVVETLFPGTPHEMVSVYHDVNGRLAMTHYCMLGNQPQLQLAGADSRHIDLSLGDSPGLNAATDQHMHALTLAWTDPDHLTQAWTCYQHGKSDHTSTFTLSRVH